MGKTNPVELLETIINFDTPNDFTQLLRHALPYFENVGQDVWNLRPFTQHMDQFSGQYHMTGYLPTLYTAIFDLMIGDQVYAEDDSGEILVHSSLKKFCRHANAFLDVYEAFNSNQVDISAFREFFGQLSSKYIK